MILRLLLCEPCLSVLNVSEALNSHPTCISALVLSSLKLRPRSQLGLKSRVYFYNSVSQMHISSVVSTRSCSISSADAKLDDYEFCPLDQCDSNDVLELCDGNCTSISAEFLDANVNMPCSLISGHVFYDFYISLFD